MRIGVDACCWSNKRGFGRFTRELLKALLAIDKKNEYLFFVDKSTASCSQFPDEANLIIVSTSAAPTEAASASGHRSLRDLWALSRSVMKEKLDLFFFPAVYSYFPIFNRAKVIVTVHDVIAEHYPELIFPNRKLKLLWQIKEYLAVRQAHIVLTVSEYSKRKVSEYFKLPESKLRLVSEAATPVFTTLPESEKMTQILSRYGLARTRFLLYVGGISPHKNLRTLLEAFYGLVMDETFSDVKLVLVGDYEGDSFYSDYAYLKSRVEQFGIAKRVIFTGFVEDEGLAILYNAASLLVLPSLEEGFGLPVVEAISCGLSVAVSNSGSLPEILGDAGCFFDPENREAMLRTFREVLGNKDLRERMGRIGLARAKDFSWNKSAETMLAIFDELEGL